MPAPPAPREPEEEMETEADSEVPHANGEVEEERERQGGEAEETMEESGEERESDLEESEAEEDEEEDEESSEMDDEDYERRRMECLDEMSDLEKQFLELKDKLFRERQDQVKVKLDEVLTGKAGEYREPLATLQHNMQLRTQVAEWWSDEVRMKKCKRRSHLARQERKKKPALVSGPYIVYMLRDIDILEDWTAIKKAKAALMPLKKKSDSRQLSARCEGGTLFYEGERFSKGNSVLLEVSDDSPAQAVITAISAGEVWFKRTDGSKTKIYISQLQKGKYTIRRA
ncbi:hypothetical protein NFI96_017642 [Prochilodus magdalenae]|nr:hypothetical protein NFI96_017642 [Prochilodus magdalenae]